MADEWGYMFYKSFSGHGIDSRQATTDRRSAGPVVFPLMESGGQFILFDRRYQSDRRLNNFIFSAKVACSREYTMTVDILRTSKSWLRPF
jgi:hypothetical protein